MTFGNILYLAMVVAAFGLFGIVLAYGEYQTRYIRHVAESERSDPNAEWLKAA